MKATILSYCTFLLLCFSLNAQQPSHYILGEEELDGVNIFSIIQGDDANIWLSTNNGIIKYDGYSYHNIKPENAKSNALFGLKKDNNGDLFCCNLNGQIFRINNDALELFYEIPDSLLSNLVHFNFDNKNRVVFCTKNYYLVEEKAKIKWLFPSEYSSNRIAKTKKGELIFVDLLSKQISFYKDGKISNKEHVDFSSNYPFSTQNELYLTRSYNPNVYYQDSSIWNKINFENIKELERGTVQFYPINDSILSFTYKNNGISFYDKKGTLKYNKSKLFPRYRISSILNDREGNIWLTTLGKGIIIIPNTDVIDFNNHPLLKEDDIKTITSNENGNLYIAGLNGVIYTIKKQKVEVLKKRNREIEFLKLSSNTNALFCNNKVLSLNQEGERSLNISSTKDVCITDSSHLYAATNQGLYSVFFNNDIHGNVETKCLTKIRTFCVTYDKKRKEIWAGTTKGLQFLSGTKSELIQYNNRPISITDIEYINNEIWVSTNNNGILIFKEGKFDRSFFYTDKNEIKTINHLKQINSKLYFTGENGLYIYDFKTQVGKNISKIDGLLSNRIKNFEVVNDKVWLLLTNGLQCINPDKINKNRIPPSIKWEDILVNNKSYKEFNINNFSHQQNQFEFRFVAVAFRHKGNLTYQYQLDGLNDDWLKKSYANNAVKFSYLPHGKYLFRVKAVNENGIESSTISYSFTISPPFWLTWWFYVLCGLGLVIIVAIYFIIRLKIVRKRLTLEKQLKTSEITAIKAQMNPHFMFNALNSIQDLIMLKDIRNSNVYLGKFADLMRKTLEFSSENFIKLTQEIEILELYLELEKLRFGDDFKATISCNISDAQLQDLQIPSLLLQPSVENAIKHGLLHKKGQKELMINFSVKGKTLICEIVDNGVGQKKSAEIKQRREKSYPSFSTGANKKRIDLIRESTNQNISLKVIDLTENDKSIGTKVVFEFN